MPRTEESIVPWSADNAVVVRSSSPKQIVEIASHHLAQKDMRAIIDAFACENYEMAATFVWSKAAAVLKRQIASLGMEFVGEMLRRPDLTEDSDPIRSISDHDAISLAEDLGLINATQGLRLSHALELVGHFTRLSVEESNEEAMEPAEALALLKNCVASILGKPNFEGADNFRQFRLKLSSATLTDADFTTLQGAPYFFVRTTLSILLALVKTTKGASQEHAIGNIGVAISKVWQQLRQPEKWQIGQAYAEVNADGNRPASAGLKLALIKVHGFDFVPESLRSNSFTEAAGRVLAAHYEWNNFYNEAEPMAVLASMGTAIPKPAFAKCMEASLAVWLGNHWGHSYSAESHADILFKSLRTEQWEYYLSECLVSDRTVLDKLSTERSPAHRWCSLAQTYKFSEKRISEKTVRKLIDASVSLDIAAVNKTARNLRERILA